MIHFYASFLTISTVIDLNYKHHIAFLSLFRFLSLSSFHAACNNGAFHYGGGRVLLFPPSLVFLIHLVFMCVNPYVGITHLRSSLCDYLQSWKCWSRHPITAIHNDSADIVPFLHELARGVLHGGAGGGWLVVAVLSPSSGDCAEMERAGSVT